ncbi:MAG: EAL domain-containing protein [Gammaproteobacteria bacterium]|nr:EAL domain-containing protein [Gammaproteobacteria bacterium]
MSESTLFSDLRSRAQLRVSASEPDVTKMATEDVATLVHELRVHQIELEMQNEELRATQLSLDVTHRRYLNLYEFSPSGHCTLGTDFIISTVNHRLSDILGIERKKLMHYPFLRLVYAQDISIFQHEIAQLLKFKKQISFDLRLYRHDQTIVHSTIYATIPRQEENHTDQIEIMLAINDTSELHTKSLELRIKSRAIENTLEGVMISKADNTICYVNPAFEQTTGYTAEEAIGRDPSFLKSGRQDATYYREMWNTLINTGSWSGEIWNRRRSGKIYPEWLSLSTIKDDYGKVEYYVGVFSDISTQTHIRERLHSLAYYDGLTDLPNRHLFHDRIKQTLADARRSNSQFALLFMDLDRFKVINDTLGHNIGDLLLVKVAERLTSVMREVDTISRMGGDEFLVLLPKTDSAEDCCLVAKKILAQMEKPFELANQLYHISISIGISQFPKDGHDPETLIKNADNAMYRAKATGLNCYQVFSEEMNQKMVKRFSLENDLRQAISKNELEIYYQPLMDIEKGHRFGAEALLRWQHPQKGFIPPDEFIPVAEENGLIVELGNWVLFQVCQQHTAWRAQGLDIGRVTVNLSPHQFLQSNLVQSIHDILQHTEMDAELLGLEITESAAMPNLEYSINTLERLQALGIKIYIDDFGTGFSSLGHLKRLPINALKIDRSFITELPNNQDDVAIVSAIIAMAKSLKLQIIAEGIEDEAQLGFLRSLGCTTGQGYLFSRPVDVAAMTAMLQKQ